MDELLFLEPVLKPTIWGGRMLAVLMDEARGLGLRKVVLQASEMGGPVYERYGFRPSGGWMELDL